MLKTAAFRRIIIATLALLLLGVLYFFPTEKTKEEISSSSLNYNKINIQTIYLIDRNQYVARTTNIIKKNEDLLKNIKERIKFLTINSDYQAYIPAGFNPIIPKNTKLIDLSLNEGLLKLNFSAQLLTVTKDDEEKMIEALIYTLTELKEVKNIMIFIEGENLTKLPHSQKDLPILLNRNYGINKIYDLTSFKNTSFITTYYLAKNQDITYYVPVTTITNNNQEKVEVIIKELKTSPIYQTNLMGYLRANAELLDYEILENEISLSFNNYIFDDLAKKNILEEVKYSISLSLHDTYNIESVTFSVDNEKIEEIVF